MGNFWDVIRDLNSKEAKQLDTQVQNSSTGEVVSQENTEMNAQDLYLSQDRIVKYRDYDIMDERLPEVSSALDIIADDAVYVDPLKNSAFWIDSPHESTKNMLEEILKNKLNMNEHLWTIVRDLVKYGDEFEEIVVSKNGVESIKPLHPSTMYRLEDAKGRLVGFEQRPNFYFNSNNVSIYASLPQLNYSSGKKSQVQFVPWQIYHTRYLSFNRSNSYGTSLLDRARYPGNMLRLMEEALMLIRLQKSFDRFAFFLDVGQLDPERSLAYVDQVRRRLRRKRFENSAGDFNSTVNPLSPLEDLFIPLKKGDSTRIDKLPGIDVGRGLEDIKYMRAKLISALRIPAAYLGFTEDYTGFVNNTLALQDKRYMRTIRRYQNYAKQLLTRICEIQLEISEVPYDEREFEVTMSNPSSLEEQAKIEIETLKADLADKLKDFVPLDWILTNVFNFTDEETKTISMKMVGANTTSNSGPDFKEQSEYNLSQLKKQGLTENQIKNIVKGAVASNSDLKESIDSLREITKDLTRSQAMQEGQHSRHYNKISRSLDDIEEKVGSIRNTR